jgi:hypothetical protein
MGSRGGEAYGIRCESKWVRSLTVALGETLGFVLLADGEAVGGVLGDERGR